jgi:acyl-coenzyme A synthetase/AMP-(fatty) acid ligase
VAARDQSKILARVEVVSSLPVNGQFKLDRRALRAGAAELIDAFEVSQQSPGRRGKV